MRISEMLLAAGIEVSEVHAEVEVDGLALLCNDAACAVASFAEKEHYLENVSENVKMILAPRELVPAILSKGKGVCVVGKPRWNFFKFHNYLVEHVAEYVKPEKKTMIGNNCRISAGAKIAEKNVVIGNNVVIEDNVVVFKNTTIEDDVVVHAGAIIGGEGFECKNNGEITFSVRHAGSVILEKGCEVQYNTCIDKAVYTWDATKIGQYSRLDNLVHVGHAIKIGKRNMLAAGSIIGGRTVTGDDVWIGIGATVCNGLHIGDGARIDIGSVVLKDVDAGCEVFGNPARVIKK